MEIRPLMLGNFDGGFSNFCEWFGHITKRRPSRWFGHIARERPNKLLNILIAHEGLPNKLSIADFGEFMTIKC